MRGRRPHSLDHPRMICSSVDHACLPSLEAKTLRKSMTFAQPSCSPPKHLGVTLAPSIIVSSRCRHLSWQSSLDAMPVFCPTGLLPIASMVCQPAPVFKRLVPAGSGSRQLAAAQPGQRRQHDHSCDDPLWRGSHSRQHLRMLLLLGSISAASSSCAIAADHHQGKPHMAPLPAQEVSQFSHVQ